MGLGLAGVPAAGLISSVGFDLIEASYAAIKNEKRMCKASIKYWPPITIREAHSIA
jgi:hypothetical protein